ncbi:uncharacterized protein LOC122136305 [Cyprinus carpio]|uniref:Uncharacterized protein LOC122136305 n=1 Tax=Cyprinus carpio TaxID=7962 RepID=A0A9Q9ZVD1_CYPCA|nr:uncharacterized protein LOC122136305 [Cyprinus carpio]
MEKHLLLILIIISGVITADQIRPNQETSVIKKEDETVTLSCSYDTSSSNVRLYWYRQYPNGELHYLIYKYSGGGECHGEERVDQPDKNIAELEGRSSSLEEVGFKALVPDVIFLNFSYSSALILHWYRQYPGSAPEFIVFISDGSKQAQESNVDSRFIAKVTKDKESHVYLEISSASISDSASVIGQNGITLQTEKLQVSGKTTSGVRSHTIRHQTKRTQTKRHQTKRTQTKRHQTKRTQTKRHQTKRTQTKRHQTKRHQTKRTQTKRHQTKRNQTKRHQTKRTQTKRHQTKRHQMKRHTHAVQRKCMKRLMDGKRSQSRMDTEINETIKLLFDNGFKQREMCSFLAASGYKISERHLRRLLKSLGLKRRSFDRPHNEIRQAVMVQYGTMQCSAFLLLESY